MFELTLLQGKKVIVFDLDGTIVNLTADWPSLKNILKVRYSKLYGNSCEFQSISGCLSKIVEKQDEQELQNFFDIIRTYEMKNIHETLPIGEIVYFVKHKEQFGIKAGTKFAILSLNTRRTIEKSLELAGIADYFDLIIGREDVRSWKPEPEGLLKIKNHFNVDRQDLIFFGDLEKDIKTGKNAGIEAYYISDLISKIKNKFSNNTE
ncbi:MAG: HAD-IA family hydrolase [Candidatus Lokiarchaeota archaeon]|jgi:HAD superfamily hydrolase (TIGR01549 family)